MKKKELVEIIASLCLNNSNLEAEYEDAVIDDVKSVEEVDGKVFITFENGDKYKIKVKKVSQ